jgi:lysophospholipase L1-like esterase
VTGIGFVRLRLTVATFCVFGMCCATTKAATGIGGPPETPSPRIETPEWWQRRHEDINARVKRGNVDLMFIGDSITQRWQQDGKDVWNARYAGYNAVNLGIDGDRTQQVLWRLDHGNIDGVSPKLAVLMIGTNNILESPPESIVRAIKAIVERLRTKLPRTKVLVLGIFPRAATHGDNGEDVCREIAKTNETIARLADDKAVFYLDISRKFLGKNGSLLKEAFAPDGVHLNAEGYSIWADAIEPLVKRLMQQQP